MNTSIIYRLKSPSGKCYIGQTKRSFEQRWYEHINRWQKWIKHNRPRKSYITKLCYAFDKYPPESWSHEVLLESLDPHEIDIKEDEFIISYDSIANGYNIQRGGQGWHGGTISEQHCENISNGRKKYWNTPEGKARKEYLSELFKNNNPHTISGMCYILTEEVKNKISEKQKQRWAAGFYKNKKPNSLESIEKMRQTKLKQFEDPAFREKHAANLVHRIGWKQSDLQKQRVSEANSDNWLVTHPNGTKEEIISLNKFCKKYGLSCGNFVNWGHTKGFTATKITSSF